MRRAWLLTSLVLSCPAGAETGSDFETRIIEREVNCIAGQMAILDAHIANGLDTENFLPAEEVAEAAARDLDTIDGPTLLERALERQPHYQQAADTVIPLWAKGEPHEGQQTDLLYQSLWECQEASRLRNERDAALGPSGN